MQDVSLQDPKQVRLHGRFSSHNNCPVMEYSGSCAEFFLRGTKARVTVTADHRGREQYMVFEVDGFVTRRFRVRTGTHTYTLLATHADRDAAALLSGAVRRLRIYKDTQANMSGEKGFLRIDRIEAEGDILEPPVRPRIEFIGDSLTSGEGSVSPSMKDIGSEGSCDEWCSFYHSWAGYLSRRLDTDWQVVSHGGWGVFCAWNNDCDMAIPPIYDKICGVVPEPVASVRGASDPYGFTFDPDAVIIHLGTNDSYSHTKPAWQNPRTGETYRTRVVGDPGPDGVLTYHPEDSERFIETTVRFVRDIAAHNPRARILWIYGMMGHAFAQILREAEKRIAASGIERFELLILPDTDPSELGANYHPLAVAHERCADLISPYIKPYLTTDSSRTR